MPPRRAMGREAIIFCIGLFLFFFSQRLISVITNRINVKLSGSMGVCTAFIISVHQLPKCLGGGTVAKKGSNFPYLSRKL